MSADSTIESLFDAARRCLVACDVGEKLARTEYSVGAWQRGVVTLNGGQPPDPRVQAGRPARPRLVAPRELQRRSPFTVRGRAALVHAIAHIEFNAVNLAWDAVYRFRGLPREYYSDWVRVAGEEAHHFRLLRGHLGTLGHDYGDFAAHNGLWEMAEKTAHDPLVRMALVPRVLEARGLDVTPGMMERFSAAGDEQAVNILSVILRDEVGHVEIGSRWFRYLCARRHLSPEETFRNLIQRYMGGRIRGPFHLAARKRAGFSPAELEYLESL